MRKSLIPFLFVGVLSTTSCTESFEPTVDYGDQTHVNDYSALLAAVNNLNKSMSERFEALNQLLDKNLTDIKLSIDANTGAIKAIGDNVDTINTTLLNGFSALNTQIDATGKQIVYAINENGEMLRLEIDANGKLISSKIEALDASLKAIVDAINSQTTKLEAKFDGLNTLIKQGFVDVIAKIGAVGDELHLDLTKIDEKLGKIDADMLAGFTNLGTKIDANGTKIVSAIDANGNKLELAINNNGNVISTAINNFHKDYNDDKLTEVEQLGEILKAIDALKQANNDNSAALIKKLEELLKDNGVYYDENNSEQMYMSPDYFTAIQNAGSDSDIYKFYADKLDVLTVSFKSAQVVNATGFTHDHAIFTPKTELDKAPVLVASKMIIVDGIANGKPVVRVVKTSVNRNYSVTIKDGCSSLFMFAMRLTDAKGQNYSKFTPTKVAHDFELVVYDESANIIKNNIIGVVYCIGEITDPTYGEVEPDKLNDQK